MPFTKIDNDQLKDLTITDAKIATNAGIAQSKISGLVATLTAIQATLALKLDSTGDTMTGPLILDADPTNALGAATKQYTDQKVSKAGDTMTGPLILDANPSDPLGAATKQYVDNTTVSLAGDIMTGSLILNADPIAALGAVTKQYVDNAITVIEGSIGAVIANFILGFQLVWVDDTSLTVKRGTCASDDNTVNITLAETPLSLAVVGDGGLDTGVLQNSKWYYIWALRDTVNNGEGMVFSLSSTSPTIDPNFDAKRNIGSFYVDGTGKIAHFTQTGVDNIRTIHITAFDITGNNGIYSLFTDISGQKAPNTAISTLLDISVDPTSTSPTSIVVSEILEETGPTLLTRKTTFGTGYFGEYWINLKSGKIHLSGAVDNTPNHIPSVKVIGYMESL